MSEKAAQNETLLALGSRGDVRVWRQNTGVAWVGDSYNWRGRTLIITNARPLYTGLCTGSSDIIGIRRLAVTRNMVGDDVGLFCAVEMKSARGNPTKEQRSFLDCIATFGGLAGVARSVDDAERIIAGEMLP